MKATLGTRWSLRAPVLLAAVAGVGLSLSGCIIDGSTGPLDSDGDGIADIYDDCPTLPEDYNGFQDNDGCPDHGTALDTDGDGIADASDACPLQPEDFNGFQDGDGCPDGGNVCLPDLTVFWRIVSNIDRTVLTCDQAGHADTVTAQIDGGSYGSVLHSFPAPCATNATTGSFKVELPASGSYNVSLELTSGATLLSETNVLVQPVDCSGLTATPMADLFVNF